MNKPRVLIGYSACPLTKRAFEAAGCIAYTCDLLPEREDSTNGGQFLGRHLRGEIWDFLTDEEFAWDFALLHPMCTYLTVSAAWALKDPDYTRWRGVGYHQRVQSGTLTGAERRAQQWMALENFQALLDLPFPVAIENPATSFVNKAIRKPDQVIHPHQFGDDASKGTGLWLTRGTRSLSPTQQSRSIHALLMAGQDGPTRQTVGRTV